MEPEIGHRGHSREFGRCYDDVVLDWQSCAGNLQVYRSSDPADVIDAANQLGATASQTWNDLPAPCSIWFYRVAP